MGWVRIDDHFDEHPKMAAVGPLGWALWIAGLAYCNRNLTDGFIPWSVARNLVSWDFLEPTDENGRQRQVSVGISSGMAGEDVRSDYVIGLLTDVGLWEVADGGYLIHDYDQYQPTKAQVEEMRDKKRRAGQAGGQASAKARAQAPAEPDDPAPDEADAEARAQAKSNPNPKRTERSEHTNTVANATGAKPRESGHNPKPKPGRPKKPRSSYQTNSQPFLLFAAFCEEMGADISQVDRKEKGKQCSIAEEFLSRGHTEDDLRRLVRYLRTEDWRTSPIDMTTCLNRVGPWKLNGSPATAEKPKTSKTTTREELMWKTTF